MNDTCPRCKSGERYFHSMLCKEREAHSETLEDLEHWKTEYEIVVARLRGERHPRDNGIIALDEIIPKLTSERDEARAVLSNISHYLSCGLGDDNTGAQEYAARIREGINFLLTPILEDNRKLMHALKEAWLAMDEVEGTDRINDWQNKNAHILNIDDKRKN